ncbi:hypothetical protein FDB81_07370 [Clostridium sporogenes]|uniref:hypothetical protein n=1 Tax=Clostridium sporogenes TaxID=1509 RepID=UPI0013D509B6|nr:hypothetical protein [Clostridium sporogenes]NFL75548.1 hypothetical protein [Clostridium sporogenes]
MIDKDTEDLINDFLQVRENLYSKSIIKENKEIQKLISCSILNNIILSKKIFKRNYMIEKFLELYFSISFSKYIYASRTMICGKITRYIYDIEDEDELINILNSIYNILSKIKDNKNVFDTDIYDVIMGIKL